MYGVAVYSALQQDAVILLMQRACMWRFPFIGQACPWVFLTAQVLTWRFIRARALLSESRQCKVCAIKSKCLQAFSSRRENSHWQAFGQVIAVLLSTDNTHTESDIRELYTKLKYTSHSVSPYSRPFLRSFHTRRQTVSAWLSDCREHCCECYMWRKFRRFDKFFDDS